ncbi:MAG: NAD-dependent deacylase [Alphaproteobacteria bacterium]|jgi:NAD-dependent deacetylase|nr:NAD-dependent deacylase [Alphaproteobacteria bacterium]
MSRIRTQLPGKASIVILTGAGISAESGLETFRGAGGLWCGHKVEDVATPEAFTRNPDMVHEFYNMRRQGLLKPEINPNPAHRALAELEKKWPGEVLVVTQNIDDLHERAGTKNLIHMHGEVLKAFCHFCRTNIPCRDDLSVDMACAACSKKGGVRPDIVWFGEMPYRMDEIFEALSNCDLFLSIGTSGNVYPAAGFVNEALRHGALTAELNLEPSLNASVFHESLTGPASITVPDFVRSVLS